MTRIKKKKKKVLLIKLTEKLRLHRYEPNHAVGKNLRDRETIAIINH